LAAVAKIPLALAWVLFFEEFVVSSNQSFVCVVCMGMIN
jgi:hypothetical protein